MEDNSELENLQFFHSINLLEFKKSFKSKFGSDPTTSEIAQFIRASKNYFQAVLKKSEAGVIEDFLNANFSFFAAVYLTENRGLEEKE